jgi:Carboxypeptidase regulatory-like domain
MRFLVRRPRALVLVAATAAFVGLVTGPATAASTSRAAGGSPTVSGHVYDDVTGSPVEGVEVALVPPADDPDVEEVWTDSDADGAFRLEAFGPGTYTLRANDFRGRYVVTRTAPFELAEGASVTGKDLRLPLAATITGLAVDAAGGEPLVNICPSAFAGRSDENIGLHASCSGLDGRWELTGLPPGPTTVSLGGDANHAGTWVGGTGQAGATVFTTTAGATTDVGDVGLHAGGLLVGRVSDQAGRPVAGAEVVVLYDNCDSDCGSVETGADGRYRLANVRPGRWVVRITVPGRPYAWQWSGGAVDPADAKPLRFGYETTTRWDAVLRPEAPLRVTVTGASEGESVSASAYTLSGAEVGWGASIDASGSGTIGGLPAGRVKVRVTVFDEDGNGREVWFGGTSSATARPIAVTPRRTTTVTVDVAN